MRDFRAFFETKINDECKKSLDKLPKRHQDLLKDYKFKFESGVNLKDYPDSVGVIHLGNPDKKLVQIAAPWRHSREFAMLHEVGHRIFEKLMTSELKKKWTNLVKKIRPLIKKEDSVVGKQDDEEIFAHSYAQYYCHNKMSKFAHKELQNFIKNLP